MSISVWVPFCFKFSEHRSPNRPIFRPVRPKRGFRLAFEVREAGADVKKFESNLRLAEMLLALKMRTE